MLRSCTLFTVATPDAEVAFYRARRAIADNGGEMMGDTYSGTFSGQAMFGRIEGRYSRIDGGFSIEITSKPLMVPCDLIRAKVRGFFR